jgi:lipopolysaccharide/colanic/teichoic acid biosynthesis glycosyltransferase
MSTFTGTDANVNARTLPPAGAWRPARAAARSGSRSRAESVVADVAVVTADPPSWQAVLDLLRAEGPGERVAATIRALEIAIAATLLVITFPIMVLVALIIRIDSPGPILFRQLRVGANGRLFRFTKFRTLYADARERWPELYAYWYSPAEVEQLHFKVKNDPRVTRAGRWLRKSTLDELPNLWHVLTGEMALVGPRPEIPEMLPYYDTRGLRKFTVRPGVTGLAQISGRGNLSFTDTVKHDVDYVDRRSAWLDTRIVATTLYRTVRREGAF